MIRIFIADDHPVYVRGLRRFFGESNRFQVVGSAERGDTAWERIRRDPPDIAILDLSMPGLTGVEVSERIAEAELPVKVVMITGTNQAPEVMRALAAGVSGYVLKTADWTDLANTVTAVMRGSTQIADDVMAILAKEIRQQQSDERQPLTVREQEVLTLIAMGQNLNQIAEELMIARSTVKSHLNKVFEKLEVKSQAAAVAEGIRKGLVK